MKKIILCLCFLCFIISVKSQVRIEAGTNFVNMKYSIDKDYSSSKSLPGITCGIIYDWYLNSDKDCYINTGLEYSNYRNKFTQKHNEFGNIINNNNSWISNCDYSLNSIILPLRLGYVYNIGKFKLDYLIGINFNILLSGNYDRTLIPPANNIFQQKSFENVKIKFDNSSNAWKRLYSSLSIAFRFHINKNISLELSGGIGLNQISKEKGTTLDYDNISFKIQYLLFR